MLRRVHHKEFHADHFETIEAAFAALGAPAPSRKIGELRRASEADVLREPGDLSRPQSASGNGFETAIGA